MHRHDRNSDEYFELNRNTNKTLFDIILIDGSHESWQVEIDIINAFECLSPNGIIVMHDCNPQTKKMQSIDDSKYHLWTGDVWRTVVLLRAYEDIDMVVGDFDYGVGVLKRRPNGQMLPVELKDKIVTNRLNAFTYEEFDSLRDVLLRLVTLQELKNWL